MTLVSLETTSGWCRPSSSRAAGLRALGQQVARELAEEGHPFPHFAAAMLAVRGERGLDQAGFAGLLGVAPSLVRALETGVVAPSESPPRLVNLVADFRRAGA